MAVDKRSSFVTVASRRRRKYLLLHGKSLDWDDKPKELRDIGVTMDGLSADGAVLFDLPQTMLS